MNAPPAKPRTATHTQTQTRQPWLWNVVLLDDDEHTYDYVITLAQELFGRTLEEAYVIARTVDTEGRAILTTTHRELAELKREQAIAFGRDVLLASSTGPMRVVIEPAETDADGPDDANDG
jgi:ATP-dependent Clp protease adaptor protein ClpS